MAAPIRGWCNRQHNRFWSCLWGFESSPPSQPRKSSRRSLAPSSSGLGRRPLKAVTAVRICSGLPTKPGTSSRASLCPGLVVSGLHPRIVTRCRGFAARVAPDVTRARRGGRKKFSSAFAPTRASRASRRGRSLIVTRVISVLTAREQSSRNACLRLTLRVARVAVRARSRRDDVLPRCDTRWKSRSRACARRKEMLDVASRIRFHGFLNDEWRRKCAVQ